MAAGGHVHPVEGQILPARPATEPSSGAFVDVVCPCHCGQQFRMTSPSQAAATPCSTGHSPSPTCRSTTWGGTVGSAIPPAISPISNSPKFANTMHGSPDQLHALGSVVLFQRDLRRSRLMKTVIEKMNVFTQSHVVINKR